MKCSNLLNIARAMLSGMLILTLSAVAHAAEADASAAPAEAAPAAETAPAVSEAATVQPAEEPQTPEEIERAEIQRRKSVLDGYKARLDAADEMADGKDFMGANSKYKEILDELQKLPGSSKDKLVKRTKSAIEDLNDDWSDDIIERAELLADNGKYTEAITVVGEARVIDLGKAEKVDYLIAEWRRLSQSDAFVGAAKVGDEGTEDAKDKDDIKRLLHEGGVYYRAGRYKDASTSFQKVLIIDPYNPQAVEMLSRIYAKANTHVDYIRQAQLQGYYAQAIWMPIVPISLDDSGRIIETPVRDTSAGGAFNRMANIVFPSIDFEDADVIAVIRFINDNSKRYDAEKQGVRVIQTFTSDDAAAGKKVNMQFSRIPMNELLRYLAQQLNFKYRVDGDVVWIGPNVDEMQTRVFPVRDDLIRSIAGSAADSAGEAVVDDGFGRTGGAAKSSSQVSNLALELGKYFDSVGVPFDFAAGASIAYNKRSNKLIVKNTTENLRRLDELLRQLSVVDQPMVLTEIKFIEITEDVYEQLGFDWTFSLTNGKGAGKLKPGWNFGANSGNLGLPDANGVVPGSDKTVLPIINGLNIFPKIDKTILGATPNLSMTLYAVSENSRTEVLSSPRVVTASGTEAEIKMVTQTKYPSGWDAPEINVNGDDNVTYTMPLPTFGDYTDTGIMMTLLPKVESDNYTITLELHPQVTEDIGKELSSYDVIMRQISTLTGQPVGVERSYNVWMPMFGVRSLDVIIKVYDGETIVLGGIVQNQVKKVENRIPVLGDLPVMGRLFTNKSEESSHKNLLIFVTARLVNTDGRPVRRAENNGIPNF